MNPCSEDEEVLPNERLVFAFFCGQVKETGIGGDLIFTLLKLTPSKQ